MFIGDGCKTTRLYGMYEYTCSQHNCCRCCGWVKPRAVRHRSTWELRLFKHWKRTYLQILYLKLEFRLGMKDFRISICTINGFVGGSQTCGSIATYHNKSTWQSCDEKISYRFQHVQLLAIHIICVRQAANKRYMSCRSIDFRPKIQLVSICDLLPTYRYYFVRHIYLKFVRECATLMHAVLGYPLKGHSFIRMHCRG